MTEYKNYIDKLTKDTDVDEVVKRMIINSKSDIWVATEDPSLLSFFHSFFIPIFFRSQRLPFGVVLEAEIEEG